MKIAKRIQKMLMLALAVVMMMASVLTVSAASAEGGSGEGGSGSSSVETPSAPAEEPSEEPTVELPSYVQHLSTDTPVAIGGKSVTTTVGGTYAVKEVAVAVITPVADLKASLGLSDSQTPSIVIFDTDVKKSHLAMKCVDDAAEALGGTVVTAINANLGAKEKGKWVALSEGGAGLVVGLPKNADTSKTYSVVCVQPGGVVTILEDQDESPETVTFEVKAGLGTYAIVAK